MGAFGYCYVFDYSNSSITEIELTKEDEQLEAEQILNKRNFDIDNCSWMFTEEKCEINIID